LDDDGEALAPSTPQKAAARCPVAQSPQQPDGRAPGKQAAQVEPDPSFLVPTPTLPPHLQTLVSNSLGPAGQDARSTKLPVSPGPPCSPYIESPPRRLRSRDQTGHAVPSTPLLFTMQDSNFWAMGGTSLESCNSWPPQIRTKTRAQHAAAALSGSRGSCWLRYTHYGNYEAWGASGNYEARGASGDYKARGASGGKYKAQMVIFRILAAVNRFSRISWKEESR
jgi:hypothetical protein